MNALQTISSKVMNIKDVRAKVRVESFNQNRLEKCEDKNGNELPANLAAMATDYANTRISLDNLEKTRRAQEGELIRAILKYNEEELSKPLSSGVKSIQMPDIKRRITISEKSKVIFDPEQLLRIADGRDLSKNVKTKSLNVKAINLDWLEKNVKEGVSLDGIVVESFDIDKFMKLIDTEIIPVDDLISVDEETGEVSVAISPETDHSLMFAELKDKKVKSK